MTKPFLVLATFAIAAALLPAGPLSTPQAPTARAWLILQQGLTSTRATKRANAVHALRLLPHNPQAQEMAENALSDQSSKVRAAAKALGPMGAASSVPKLKAVLNDKEPAVVLAAAHSLFLLGERAVAMMGFETGLEFMPFGGEAYEALKRISKDDRTPVRAAAAKELATDRETKIDAALARACSDKRCSVRVAAEYAIAKRGDFVLLNVIAPILHDKNDIVRYDASAAELRLSRKAPELRLSGKAAE